MQRRLALIASDFAALYGEAASQQLLTPNGLNLNAFKALFDRMNIEYMHYAGAGATQPFFEDVVENLLRLAVAYITLPPAAAPRSRAFGLYLAFLLYATQPGIATSPVKLKMSLGTLQRYVEDIDSTAANKQGVPTCLGCHVSDGERQLLLALHKAGALNILPFTDDSLYVRTLIEVHEKWGLPLLAFAPPKQSSLRPPAASDEGTCTDNDVSKQLEAYREMRQRINFERMKRR